MAFSLLDFIKGEGAAVSFIRSAVEAGKAASETLEALRNAGLGIRTQTFYQVVNYFKGPVETARNYVSYLGLQNLPNIARLPKTLTNIAKNFTYELKVEVISSETGEKTTRTINVSSNTLLSKQEAIDTIAGIIEENPNNRYSFEFSGAQVTNIFQNAGGLVNV